MKLYIVMKDYKKSDFQNIEAIFEAEDEAKLYAKELQEYISTEIIEYYIVTSFLIKKKIYQKK